MTDSAVLPSLLLLTDRRAAEAQGRTLVSTVASAVEAGARAVLLREKDLPAVRRLHLAQELRHAMAGSDARLGIASDPHLAARVDLDWVHLSATDPLPPDELLLGRSCHDLVEVRNAATEGCKYVTVSPVAPSASKPRYGPALGAERLAEICQAVAPLPVYALGGVDAANAESWLAAGAQGVATMGAVMAAADPANATRQLLDALRACGPMQ